MIGKIPKPGKSFGGVIEYNVLKKDAAILYADGVRIDKIAHTIDDFNMQRKMNPGLGQAVGHIALSWSPEDKERLNDEKMVSIAKEYLQKMKIQNTQILIVKHKDREHPHIHIVYNRVNNNGKTIADNFQHLKNIKISKELTLKYGMHIGQGKRKVNRPQLKLNTNWLNRVSVCSSNTKVARWKYRASVSVRASISSKGRKLTVV